MGVKHGRNKCPEEDRQTRSDLFHPFCAEFPLRRGASSTSSECSGLAPRVAVTCAFFKGVRRSACRTVPEITAAVCAAEVCAASGLISWHVQAAKKIVKVKPNLYSMAVFLVRCHVHPKHNQSGRCNADDASCSAEARTAKKRWAMGASSFIAAVSINGEMRFSRSFCHAIPVHVDIPANPASKQWTQRRKDPCTWRNGHCGRCCF